MVYKDEGQHVIKNLVIRIVSKRDRKTQELVKKWYWSDARFIDSGKVIYTLHIVTINDICNLHYDDVSVRDEDYIKTLDIIEASHE